MGGVIPKIQAQALDTTFSQAPYLGMPPPYGFSLHIKIGFIFKGDWLIDLESFLASLDSKINKCTCIDCFDIDW